MTDIPLSYHMQPVSLKHSISIVSFYSNSYIVLVCEFLDMGILMMLISGDFPYCIPVACVFFDLFIMYLSLILM
jgi:hypothetical protein